MDEEFSVGAVRNAFYAALAEGKSQIEAEAIANGGGKPEAESERDEIDEIKAKLDDLGVKYDGRLGIASLRDLLAAAEEA